MIKLTITKEVQDAIDYMHKVCPKNTEWSGTIIHKAIDPFDPTAEIVVEGFLPMDIGTASYTEFKPSDSIHDLYDAYPQLEEGGYVMGTMHTHHNMSAFFSAVDTKELQDNSKHYPYYLSLIVNYSGEYTAKIGVDCDVEEVFSKNGVVISRTSKKAVTEIAVDIVGEEVVVSELMAKKVAELVTERAKPKTTIYRATTGYTPKIPHNSKNTKDIAEINKLWNKAGYSYQVVSKLSAITREKILIDLGIITKKLPKLTDLEVIELSINRFKNWKVGAAVKVCVTLEEIEEELSAFNINKEIGYDYEGYGF